MNRQIRQCTFNVAIDDGSTVTAVSGFPVNVAVTSGSYTYKPYYHTGQPFDEALNGRLRSQLGGYRFEASLTWDRLINAAPLASVLNNAYTTNLGEVIITFYPDATNTVVFENVIITDSVWDARIDATIIRQPLGVSIRGRDLRSEIPAFYIL
jgi:hypothetical protein